MSSSRVLAHQPGSPFDSGRSSASVAPGPGRWWRRCPWANPRARQAPRRHPPGRRRTRSRRRRSAELLVVPVRGRAAGTGALPPPASPALNVFEHTKVVRGEDTFHLLNYVWPTAGTPANGQGCAIGLSFPLSS
jgi:hypothetical protein